MADEPLMNSTDARSPTGEIIDQATPPAETPAAADTTTPPETAPADPAKPATPAAAPETYAEFKAPEGYTLDAKAIEAAVPIFKDLGLSQDQAQKLVDFHVKQMLDAAKAPQDAYTTMRSDWQAKVLADADMKAAVSGGKTGLDAVKVDIGRALNSIGDPGLVAEFKQAMDITGAGDHPAFVKAMWKLSQHITEGSHVAGAGPSPAGQRGPNDRPTSTAKALYPNLP